MEICRTQLDPSTGLELTLALMRNVKNSGIIKEEVMSGQLKCCVMKASLICDPFQVIVAANKAALSHHNGTGLTKNVYTELLFILSISKNISQSLMKFGVGDADEELIVAVIERKGGSSIGEMLSRINGCNIPLTELSLVCDKKQILKTYKIKDTEITKCLLVDSVVSRIVTSEFVSH